MEDNVMFTVFHVYYPDLKTEIYLLDYWVVAEDEKISKWVQTLTNTGVGDRKVKFLPVCKLDCGNIAWSRKDMLTSITIEL